MAADQVQEVKERTDLVSLISKYVSLKKAGKNHKGLCPFHQEKTPSFMVSPELQIWKCFGCGEAGDAFNFLMKIEGMEFGESLQTLAGAAGVTLTSRRPSGEDDRKKRLIELNHRAGEFFHYLLADHAVGQAAREYLTKERGYPAEVIKEFKLGYAPNSWDSLGKYLLSKNYTLSELVEAGLVVTKEQGRGYYDRFRGRIIFPLADIRGRTVGFAGRVATPDQEPKYLNSAESLIFNKSNFLYGLFYSRNAIRQARVALVVEGPTDFLTLFSKGTKHVVASQGTALTRGQVKLLKRYAPAVAFCFDTDLAGDRAIRRGVELAESEGLEVSVVSLPEKFKDADECARQDWDAWEKAAANPIPVYEYYFRKALARYDRRTPEGRKKVAQEVLPVFKGIGDEIQRASYVQRLSSELDVSLEVIEAALARVPDDSSKGTERGEWAPRSLERSEYPSREFYVLALLLQAPKDRAEAVLYRLGKDDFSHPNLRQLFVKLKNYHRTTQRFSLKNFRARIRHEKALVKLLEELALQDFGLEDDKLDDELEVGLFKLKHAKLRRAVRELGKEIKAAETVGDKKQVLALQKDLKGFLAKIK